MSRGGGRVRRAPHPSPLSSSGSFCPSLCEPDSLSSELCVSLSSLSRHPSASQIVRRVRRRLELLRCGSLRLRLLLFLPSFLPFACGRQVKPLFSFLPSALLLSLLLPQLPFVRSSFSFSVCSSQCASPVTHAQCFDTHMHTHTLCLSVSGSLLMHVACSACPPPISLSLSHTLPLVALSPCSTHCSASAGRITFSVVVRDNILADA